MTNFPAGLQPSSTCQWFRLLTVCCQCLTNQPIVFCVVRPTLNSLALAKRAVSLFSSRAAALVSRVSRLRRSHASALLSLNLKKKRDLSQSTWAFSVVPHFSLSPPRFSFSRVGWFSRALAFRSLYYPWGKMETTRSQAVRDSASILTHKFLVHYKLATRIKN